MEKQFDPTTAEAAELDLQLLDKGMSFNVPVPPPKEWYKKPFAKTTKQFTIYQPFLGTLDYLGRELLELEYNEERLRENPVSEVKYLAAKNARHCARIVAIMVLRYQEAIKENLDEMTDYFLDSVNPATLYQITAIIHKMGNFRDFTASMGYLSIQSRTTMPKPIETTTTGKQPD